MVPPSPAIATVPEGYSTVSPWVISRDTDALFRFITSAFAGVEVFRMATDDGSIGHAEIRIGESVVLAFDAPPEWQDTPAFLRLYLADGDAAFARAVDAGAEPVTEMTEMSWGDRVGRVRDPLGNLWWIHTRVVELTLDEAAERAARPEFVEAMRYVSGADLAPTRREPGSGT